MPRKSTAVKVRVWAVTEATAIRRGAAFPAARAASPEYYSAVIEDGEGSSEVVLLRTGRRAYVAGPEGVDQSPQHGTPRGDLLCWASAECDRGGTHAWDEVNDQPLGDDAGNGAREQPAPDTLTLEAPAGAAPRRASTAAAARPRTSTTQRTPVDAIVHHEDARTNIPTEQLRDFVEESEDTQLRYARDPSLDPQLVWKGKDDLDGEDLAVWLRPIFIQEKIHPLALIEDLRRQSQDRAGAAQQLDFFADFNGIDSFEKKLEFYQHDQHWSNRMILGDSLMVMASLAEKEGLRGKVQTIYLDPPYGIKFGSNWQVSTRKRDVRDGRAEDATREPEMVRAFRDTWQLGVHSYLTYLRDRFTVARDLLTESGSIFVQIGDENVHLVRAVLDEVFGSENYCAHIAFRTTGAQTSGLLAQPNDSLLWYARSRSLVKFRRPLAPDTTGSWAAGQDLWTEERFGYRRRLSADEKNMSQSLPVRVFRHRTVEPMSGSTSTTFELGIEGRVFQPAPGKGWSSNLTGMTRLIRADRLFVIGNSVRYPVFFDDFGYMELTSTWGDTMISGFSDPKAYVVQTAVKVVQRCLLMTTDPGDLVLDPTCGSGTTAYVAEQWGRRWITVDTSRVALTLARTRLMSARYPHYLLADSIEGRRRQVELLGEHTVNFSTTTTEDVRQGFVYRRVPHIQLRDIANNEEIDVIWERWQATLEPLRAALNTALRESWEEWQVPRDAGEDWPPAALEGARALVGGAPRPPA